MLSSTVAGSISDGKLRIVGTDDPDSIVISSAGAGITVAVDGQSDLVFPNSVSSFAEIIVFGQAGGDRVVNDTSIPMTALGGDGNDVLIGGSSADDLDGGVGNDELDGRGGDDKLVGGDGDDTVNGGDGNDTINGGNGKDRLDGQAGNDELFGLGGDDTIFGGPGNDVLVGHVGNDILNGGSGDDFLDGREGDDVLHGLAGNDRLFGGPGKDTLLGHEGDDFGDGGTGNDTLEGGPGKDTLYGRDGDDRLVGNEERDKLFAGDGKDVLLGGDGPDLIDTGDGDDTAFGGPGDDDIYGRTGNDTLHGDEGDDWIHAAEGNDVSYGGPGNDFIQGREGDDVSYGEDGDDKLYGQAGDDKLYGQAGNDLINGGVGNDLLDGGEDADTIYGTGGVDEIIGGPGDDSLFGNAGNDVIRGDEGDDYIDGGEHNDLAEGGEGDDKLYGREGNDRLLGGPGDDVLNGFEGNDYLDGEEGHDRIFGKEGDDRIYGRAGNDNLVGHDGEDSIYGNDGNDYLDGGPGVDGVFGGNGFDYVETGGNNDAVDGERIDGNFLPEVSGLEEVYLERPTNSTAVPFSAIDMGGETLTVTATSSSADVTAEIVGAEVHVTAAQAFVGQATIEVSATDGIYTDSRRFVVHVRNQAPEIEPISDRPRLQNAGTFRVGATIIDSNADDVTVVVASSSPSLVVEWDAAAQQIVATPENDFTGEAVVTVTVTDSAGASSESSFTVSIDASIIVKEEVVDGRFVRLDSLGNLVSYTSNGSSVGYAVLGTDVKSFVVASNGTIFRLGNDGSFGYLATDGDWVSVELGVAAIDELFVMGDDIVLLPTGEGSIFAYDTATGEITERLSSSVTNLIVEGTLYSLTSDGRLYENFVSRSSSVSEIVHANRRLYYRVEGTSYSLQNGLFRRESRYSDRIASVQGEYVNYSRDYGIESVYVLPSGITVSASSIGIRQKMVVAGGNIYELAGTSLYVNTNLYVVDGHRVTQDVKDVIANDDTVFVLKTDGKLFRLNADESLELLAEEVQQLFHVGRKAFALTRGGAVLQLFDSGSVRVGTGVKQLSIDGDHFRGDLYALHEDGRIARFDSELSTKWQHVSGSVDDPYVSFAIGFGDLLAVREVNEQAYVINKSTFARSFVRPSSSAGVVVTLVEADGVAIALYEDGDLYEWDGSSWDDVATWSDEDKSEYILGVDFKYLASDGDRAFASDSDGFLWTIPLRRSASGGLGFAEWMTVERPESGFDVNEVVSAAGSIFARSRATVFRFSDVNEWTDHGDWATVAGYRHSNKTAEAVVDLASAQGELFGLWGIDRSVRRIDPYTGALEDISGGYQFSNLKTSTNGILIGTRYPNGEERTWTGSSWEPTTVLYRKGRELIVTGRNELNDVLQLGISGAYITATVNDPYAVKALNLRADPAAVVETKEFRFLRSTIDRITYHGLGGNDTLELLPSWNSAVPVTAFGGSGDDTLEGVVGYDQLFSGTGADKVALTIDFDSYLSGNVEGLNSQADFIGDEVSISVDLGDGIEKAAKTFHDFLKLRLRPLTKFFNSVMVNIPEMNLRVTWGEAADEIPGLRELRDFHDDLLDLADDIRDLPTDTALRSIGTFKINGGSFSDIVGPSTNVFEFLLDSDAVRELKGYKISLPFLEDPRQFVRVAMGGVADLVEAEILLSEIISDAAKENAGLKDARGGGLELEEPEILTEGVYFIGPVPIQYWVNLNVVFDFGLTAGLDTRGLATGRLDRIRNGLYVKDFLLKAAGKISAETGWDVNASVESRAKASKETREAVEQLLNLTSVKMKLPALKLGGEIEVGQEWTLSRSQKAYLYGGNVSRPTLSVDAYVTGRLYLTGTFGFEAKGWAADAIDLINDAGEQVVDIAGDAYVEVVELLYNILGAITGRKTKKVRKPEWQIPKEVCWDLDVVFADVTRREPAAQNLPL